ncbi:MAG TPA: class I SAM-dependent methyltransferase [Verrucomicrobiae bacterium]|nr:class I SAM-dependent methyltransferase [Verrucomicrobiae bacterium]
MSATESRFIDRKVELPATVIERAELSHPGKEFKNEAEWLRCVREDFPKFIPFLTKRCGLEFRGRVLEIGSGGAWFSAELSKLPQVVEITATDVSHRLLKVQALKVFKLLKAKEGKITRIPADFGKLDFPANHFDVVVCADALHQAVSLLRVLREVRRVLKPGGTFVGIREPVRPLMKFRSRTNGHSGKPNGAPVGYAVSEYRDFFEHAGLKLELKRVVLSRGFKYYFDKAVNGLTHARYAFVATKAGR